MTFSLRSQTFESLQDSVEFYKNKNPQKALNFGLKAIDKGYQEGISLSLLQLNTLVGEILKDLNLDDQAIRFLEESLKIFQALPQDERKESKVELPAWVLVNIGNIYFKNNIFDLAEQKYLEAKKNFELYENRIGRDNGLSTVYDNLALINLEQENFIKAKQLYDKSASIRKINNKAEDILYSKLGYLTFYIKQNNFKNAELTFQDIKSFYLEKNIYSSNDTILSSYMTRNYGYSQLIYGAFMLKRKELSKAMDLFGEAKESLVSFPVELPEIDTYIAECFFLMQKYDQAKKHAEYNISKYSGINYRSETRKNLLLLESIFKYNNDFENLLKIKNKILDLYKIDESFVLDREINQLESYLILTEKQNNQNEERLKYNKYIFILIIIILLMILVFVFFRLNYNIQRLRLKKIEDDKRLVLMELENKKLALANTNNFISQQSQNLKNLLESPRVNLRSKELRGKIQMLVTSFVINDNFEKLFEEVYPDFYQKLLDINNSLTQNDLKLCACIRLNQTSKDIALRMGVSTRTIESQKYRLKKKLRLDKNQKLLSFIISL